MNSDRESELRRRLETTDIPPPPAGLADRIRGDIPEELFSGKDAVRPRRSRLFPLQIAASLLLLAGSAYMVTRVLLISDPAAVQTAAFRKTAPVLATAGSRPAAALDSPAQDSVQDPAPLAPADEVAQEGASRPRVDDERQSSAPPTLIAEAAPASAKKDRVKEESDRDEGESGAFAPQLPTAAAPAAKSVADAQADSPVLRETASGSVAGLASMEAGERAPAAPAQTSSRRAGNAVVPQAVTTMQRSARIFGISVDESSVARVRDTLGRGETPLPASVNGGAFISYFAGPGKRNESVSLDAEGSTMPGVTSGRRVLLRFSVDTASAAANRGPVGRDARIDLSINPDAVASFRRIGGEEKLPASEPLLQHDVSVTAVYELELLPRTMRPQQVATVTMRYRDAGTGRSKTLTRRLDVRDFESNWSAATRRHRLATLSGLLSESLQGTASGIDLARRAEELANQKPDDSRARELANAATASSRLRSSSPTGSGR